MYIKLSCPMCLNRNNALKLKKKSCKVILAGMRNRFFPPDLDPDPALLEKYSDPDPGPTPDPT